MMGQDLRFYELFPTVIKIGILTLCGLLLFFANRRVSSKINTTWLNFLGETGLRGLFGFTFAFFAILVCFVEPPETPLGDRLRYWVDALGMLGFSLAYLWRRFAQGLISTDCDDPIIGLEPENYRNIFAEDQNLDSMEKSLEPRGKSGRAKNRKKKGQ